MLDLYNFHLLTIHLKQTPQWDEEHQRPLNIEGSFFSYPRATCTQCTGTFPCSDYFRPHSREICLHIQILRGTCYLYGHCILSP